jgi:hypothetical protein
MAFIVPVFKRDAAQRLIGCGRVSGVEKRG